MYLLNFNPVNNLNFQNLATWLEKKKVSKTESFLSEREVCCHSSWSTTKVDVYSNIKYAIKSFVGLPLIKRLQRTQCTGKYISVSIQIIKNWQIFLKTKFWSLRNTCRGTFVFCFEALGTEPRHLAAKGKCSMTELHHQPLAEIAQCFDDLSCIYLKQFKGEGRNR